MVGYICSIVVCVCFHSANLVSRQGSVLTLPLSNKGFLVVQNKKCSAPLISKVIVLGTKAKPYWLSQSVRCTVKTNS